MKGYEPQSPSAGASGAATKKNQHQGSTPLHFACGTGIADTVQVMAEYRADFNITDDDGRGCLQLAKKCQGKNRTLYNWLIANVQGIQMTNGEGRAPDERGRGAHSYLCRIVSGPDHKGKGKGYEPHESEGKDKGKGIDKGKGKGNDKGKGKGNDMGKSKGNDKGKGKGNAAKYCWNFAATRRTRPRL